MDTRVVVMLATGAQVVADAQIVVMLSARAQFVADAQIVVVRADRAQVVADTRVVVMFATGAPPAKEGSRCDRLRSLIRSNSFDGSMGPKGEV